MKLYEETSSKIRVGNKIIGEIWNEKGVRQGCKLSSDMYNIYMSDLEEELKEVRDGGLVVGRKKIWSISYADDIALVATNVEEMRCMMKKLEKYLEKKKLELNAEKSKIMIVGEKRGRKRKEERSKKWYWKGKEIEIVKKFNYLGYLLTDNNKDIEHVGNQVAKAKVMLGKVWSIGQRFMKDNWKERMILFMTLIRSIIFYGVEIWGWKEYAEVEKVQKKFVKWTLRLERTTPDYIIRRETKITKMVVETRKRARKYEEKIEELSIDDIRYESYRRKLLVLGIKCRYDIERDKALAEININEEIVKEWRRRSVKISEKIEEYNKEKIKSEDIERVKKSEYVKENREWLLEEWERDNEPEYLRKGKEIQLIANFRIGGGCLNNRYWMSEYDRKCRLCGVEGETINHVFNSCVEIKNNKDIKEILSESGNSINILKTVEWRRKEKLKMRTVEI